MTEVTELLRGLYDDYEARRKSELPKTATLDRPRTITYEDGTSVILERVATHLPEAHCDRITIRTSNGTYVLNDMTKASVLFIDGGGSFECSPELRDDGSVDFFIFYNSIALELRSGLYSLLHEFCHVAVYGSGNNSTAHIENAVWDAADKLASKMGLILFDNATEQRLYRDICVRTNDLDDAEGIDYESIIRDIHFGRFGREVIFGLLEAAKQGVPLEEICAALLSEARE